MSTVQKATDAPRVHPVDEVPPVPKLLTYGFQHVAAFYAGAVIVPIIIGGALGVSGSDMIKLIQADLLTCGIASLLQAVGIRIGKFRIGVQLPLLQGVAFAGVAPLIAIGSAHGGGSAALPFIFGAVIVSGIVFFLVAPLIAKIVRFFPPVVTGTVLTIIGVTLMPVAANHAIGGQLGLPGFDWAYGVMGASPGGHGDPSSPTNFYFAVGTIILILVLQRFFTGFLSTIAVLLGLIGGSVVWFLTQDTDFTAVNEAGWFWFATPFHFGMPQVTVSGVILVLLVMMITAVETVGSLYATGDIVGKRITQGDVAAALRADGVSTTIGGSMGSFPYTCFAENIGLVRVTGVKSRWIVAMAAVFMVLLGLFPKAAAVVALIPEPVLGGAALMLFAAVAVVGIQLLGSVDFNDHRNLIVAGTGIAMGMYVMAFPGVTDAVPSWLEWYFSGGIAAGAFTTILLNLIFFHIGRDHGPAVTTDSAGDLVHLDQINEMSRAEFGETFGHVVQQQDWALDVVYGLRPFASPMELGEAFQDSLLTATNDEQDTLINSYADFGSDDPVEQAEAFASIDPVFGQPSYEEHEELIEVARAHREKFGFPLIISERDDASFAQMLGSYWARMDNSPAAERQETLIEVSKIFNHRFNKLVADANPISTARFQRFKEVGQ
ncbi:xanthine permease [Gordonia iterans]|uniref:Xanthine permease n=1 Tax=Gordonia iterans TaxID=1004901 RepID=A0A2S0KFD3_9ACTN|nr:solute carrier family 23 protein [Gordonia iterans]AVM00402.1 xanthine permease [Gordonia iterans]